MAAHDSVPLGVVVERRRLDSPWQDHAWRSIAVVPGAPPVTGWRRLRDGDDWAHFHAATLELELHGKETEGYRANLAQAAPAVYVVLRPAEGDDAHEVAPFLVTACPYEAQDYDDSGEEIVDAVPMPDDVRAWVQAFVDRHHVEVPFKKRKREPHDARAGEPARGRRGG